MTDIIIMDLDGVLCDNSHRAHLVPPADRQHRNEAWRPFVEQCINDAPIDAGVALYESLIKAHRVVIVTSRQDLFANESRSWLKNNINTWGYPDVIFRSATDHSTPTDYKRDVLKTLRGRGYNILFAVDDDPAIIDMYNAEGVATFQSSTRCSSCK
jgi:phosphoglycolate phosphatase-like HAD superfamily hydrolase